jgi:putative GTP pyrophosphokinase
MTAKVTADSDAINAAVKHFEDNIPKFEHLAKTVHLLLSEHPLLKPYIHSLKYRVKDKEHLREKLVRKALEAKRAGKQFGIDRDNLFTKIEDLAGVRILHLHSQQVTQIHPTLITIFNEERYRIASRPEANTWDDEYRQYFKSLNIKTTSRPSMYTSIHYIVESNSKSKLRCEIQVRTLVEEVWGEVSHTINYPTETESVACREQLKVLARVASSCTRLVDSIFASRDEHASATGSKRRS